MTKGFDSTIAATPIMPDWGLSLQLMTGQLGAQSRTTSRALNTNNVKEDLVSPSDSETGLLKKPETKLPPHLTYSATQSILSIGERYATHANPIQPLSRQIANGINMALDSSAPPIDDIDLAIKHIKELENLKSSFGAQGLTNFERDELKTGVWRRDLIVQLCHLDWRTLIYQHGELAKDCWFEVVQRNVNYRNEKAVFDLPVTDIYLLRYLTEKPELLADVIEESRRRVKGVARNVYDFKSLSGRNPFETVSMRNAHKIFHALMEEAQKLKDANPFKYPSKLRNALRIYSQDQGTYTYYTEILRTTLAA